MFFCTPHPQIVDQNINKKSTKYQQCYCVESNESTHYTAQKVKKLNIFKTPWTFGSGQTSFQMPIGTPHPPDVDNC
jgi:hypothetical protein